MSPFVPRVFNGQSHQRIIQNLQKKSERNVVDLTLIQAVPFDTIYKFQHMLEPRDMC